MRLLVDTEAAEIAILDGDRPVVMPLYSAAALECLSRVWLRVQWTQRQWCSFSWMGMPIWQLPDDLMRLQEVVLEVAPDVILETGLNRGGSAVFLASLCSLAGRGRVVSIEASIDPAVRRAIEAHPLGDRISLIEGDSAAATTAAQARRMIDRGERVFVVLDSDHSRAHVAAELDLYAPLVSVGSYIVACDGVMELLADTPHGKPAWQSDNPAAASRAFAASHPEFELARPRARCGEEYVIEGHTYWPDAWLRRIAG